MNKYYVLNHLPSCRPLTRQAWGKSNAFSGQEPSPTVTSKHSPSKRIWRPPSPGSDGAGLGTCYASMPTPSPKLQSTGHQRERESVVDRRQPGEELWQRKWRTWTTAGAPSRGWPVTDTVGGASLLPCTPTGVTGSNWFLTLLLLVQKKNKKKMYVTFTKRSWTGKIGKEILSSLYKYSGKTVHVTDQLGYMASMSPLRNVPGLSRKVAKRACPSCQRE